MYTEYPEGGPVSSEPPWVEETIPVREQVPVACPDNVVHVTAGVPPVHWKTAENVVVVKLLGLGVIAEFVQFDEKVGPNVAVVLGAFNW